MKNSVLVVIAIAVVIMLGFVGWIFRSRFDKKPAGLEINTTPSATVYIDGKSMGTTPYVAQNLAAGVYTIRLVPESTGSAALAVWETKMDLTARITTIINRTFAESDADSSGSILQEVKEPGGKTYLSVISEPDTINLSIDGVPDGFTPVTKKETAPGAHQLSFTSPGYKPQDLQVDALVGYNLIVNVKLAVDQLVLATPRPASPDVDAAAPSASASSSATPAPSTVGTVMVKPYVIVEETGTGWLRVRKEPSSTADELGKANTGEKLKYLGESTETGWYKVEFEKMTGWVSGKYTQLVK